MNLNKNNIKDWLNELDQEAVKQGLAGPNEKHSKCLTEDEFITTYEGETVQDYIYLQFSYMD